MRDVCFIADTAVLPRWLRVAITPSTTSQGCIRASSAHALRSFWPAHASARRSRIGELSKGMITQLHLALILAIDARLLVLDEPTLGLDLIYRRQFYDTLLNDYFDHERTILLTTHQVEEVENLLTDVMFVDRGHIVLDAPVEELPQHYVQLTVAADKAEAARALKPFYVREVFGRRVMLFEDRSSVELAGLGELATPRIADLFVAKVGGEPA